MMKMASLIQFTLPGVPSVYYGDEVGMQGMKDPFNRGCMQWDNKNTELLIANGEPLVREIDDLVSNLMKFKYAIVNGDEKSLHDLMEKGNKIKEEIG